jgi:hypothetical protein
VPKYSREWVRPTHLPDFHAVASVVYGGRVTAYCRVSWDESVETERCERPAYCDVCDACQRVLVDSSGVLAGLEEITNVWRGRA